MVSVYLRGRELDRLPVGPGSSSSGGSSTGRAGRAAHPYSLSAAPHPTMLRITVKDLGDGSRRLADLRPGTRVLVEGPYGAADRRPPHPAGTVTLLACGIGITPLRALLRGAAGPARPR